MEYYFIYSAGGGAGDWNGVKRVWQNYMPESIKSHILLKFGDVFLNHATHNAPYRTQRWETISNLRQWLFEATNDTFVINNSIITLDSGTAKLVNYIDFNNPGITNTDLIGEFIRIVSQYRILEKYINVVVDSNIDRAVTFDIPNPFKIRSQNGNARINILGENDTALLIRESANYSNTIRRMLIERIGAERTDDILYTIINGSWSVAEYNSFIQQLDYTPKHIAVGGLSSSKGAAFTDSLIEIGRYNIPDSVNMHFLGCGGISKVRGLHDYGYSNNQYSVDCSTVINRTIDGNLAGTAQSCYYSYQNFEQIRINPDTVSRILALHRAADNPLYTADQMDEILSLILQHQSNQSSIYTYDARAKLLFHNSDVFKRLANM